MVLIPAWAQWINQGYGTPPCCYTCLHYDGGLCVKYAAVPPEEFLDQPGACDQWESFDKIPF